MARNEDIQTAMTSMGHIFQAALTSMERRVFNRFEEQEAKNAAFKEEHEKRIGNFEDSNKKTFSVIQELKEALEQSRSFLPGSPPVFSPVGSSHENSVDSGRSSSDKFVANHVFVRGWAPFGTGKECKINIKEYETCAKEIKNMLFFDCQRHVFIDQLVPRNFQISYRVVGGTDKCHDVCLNKSRT